MTAGRTRLHVHLSIVSLVAAMCLVPPLAAQDVQRDAERSTSEIIDELRGEPGAVRRLADRLAATHELLRQWRYEEAFDEAEALHSEHPKLPAVKFLAGRARFYQQDYEGAIELLEKVAGESGARSRYLEYARAAFEATQGYVKKRSENFEVRVAPGADEILIPLALEALESARANIGADFDYFPPRRVVVEVYTNADDLGAASGLPSEAIRNSGTVAVCKHNKIMITTPRALLLGYTWLDTLAHEYVHFVVSRVSHNTVPIWLHEGLARHLETRWRGEGGMAMSPYAEVLLAEAVRGDRDFITFEEMHPSMAYLPTQEHTSLAFAQVSSVMEYFLQQGGHDALRRVMAKMREGENEKDAIAAALETSFDAFMDRWRAWLARKALRADAGASLRKVTYADSVRGRVPETAEEDIEVDAELEDSTADRHARLGDLLHMREHVAAALIQYEKAYEAAGPAYPRLPNRLAVTHMRLGNMERALEVLKEALDVNPGYVTTHVHLGRLYRLTESWEKSREAYERAAHINPFDPEIHMGLIEVCGKLGDEDGVERASASLALLRREAGRAR